MPVVFIDAPPGIRADAKKKMMETITTLRLTTSVTP